MHATAAAPSGQAYSKRWMAALVIAIIVIFAYGSERYGSPKRTIAPETFHVVAVSIVEHATTIHLKRERDGKMKSYVPPRGSYLAANAWQLLPNAKAKCGLSFRIGFISQLLFSRQIYDQRWSCTFARRKIEPGRLRPGLFVYLISKPSFLRAAYTLSMRSFASKSVRVLSNDWKTRRNA